MPFLPPARRRAPGLVIPNEQPTTTREVKRAPALRVAAGKAARGRCGLQALVVPESKAAASSGGFSSATRRAGSLLPPGRDYACLCRLTTPHNRNHGLTTK